MGVSLAGSNPARSVLLKLVHLFSQPQCILSACREARARLAQSVEHQTFNLRVAGSSPSSGDGNFEEPKITKMKKKRRLGPSFKKLPKLTVFDVF